ncbi:MAG: hypothetical protein ACYS0D_11710 [Planctomycetota bacterium]
MVQPSGTDPRGSPAAARRRRAALFTHQGPTNYQDVARALGIAVGSIGPSRARCFAKLLEIYQRLERGNPGESNPNVSIPASRSPK